MFIYLSSAGSRHNRAGQGPEGVGEREGGSEEMWNGGCSGQDAVSADCFRQQQTKSRNSETAGTKFKVGGALELKYM